MSAAMNRNRWIAVALSAAVLLAVGVWAFRRGEEEAPKTTTAGTDDGAMGGMAMEEEEGGTIRLTAEQIRTFGVTFGTVEKRPLEKTIRAVGLVDFDETRMAYVSPKFMGWVERLYVDFTGMPVSRGQPLLEIYSPDLVSAQEELLLAARLQQRIGVSAVEGVAAGGASLLEAAKRRLLNWDISEAQIDRVLRTGRVQRTLTFHAPVSGIVMEKDVFEGQAVEPGDNLYMIADLSEVWIEAEIFEADLALVHEGMPATVSFAALPGATYAGRVEYVYPTLEQASRSMRARIALPNPGRRIKPGMYATVTLERALGEVLTIPRPAVLRTGDKAVAFVDMGEGRLMPHELTLGIEGDEYVEALAGVEPGQRVVTSAQYLLDSESNLAEVMRAMMTQMGTADMGRHAMPGMEGRGTMPSADTSDMRMPGTDTMRMGEPGMPRRR